MSSLFKGEKLSVSVFGESHGAGIGVVIDNVPSGEKIDFEKILDFMARRAPKKDGTSTMRSEKDFPEIMSGIVDGVTTGTPICALIRNTDQHSADYKSVSHKARPGHADYTGYVRYNGANDLRGGGHFSGRITAPVCFAGAVCGQLLEHRGIYTGAHIGSVMNVKDERFNPVDIKKELLEEIKKRSLPLIDESKT
ncbi:MAG: chorismate synthase, partial [Ruminiclostridium sp.]